MHRLAIAIALICSACDATQPANDPTVAAFEVTLATADDRNHFLNMMREEAKASGFHVDAVRADELKTLSNVSPMTFSAAVWVGKDVKEPVASAIDFKVIWVRFGSPFPEEANQSES